MKKCIIIAILIYLAYSWLPPFLTLVFPVNTKKIAGNYIVHTCQTDSCSFYLLHFSDNNKLKMQCFDENGTSKASALVKWKLKNGHSVVIESDYDRYLFPHFGAVHRNLFFPWVIKIEAAVDGQCELEQWNFATKL